MIIILKSFIAKRITPVFDSFFKVSTIVYNYRIIPFSSGVARIFSVSTEQRRGFPRQSADFQPEFAGVLTGLAAAAQTS